MERKLKGSYRFAQELKGQMSCYSFKRQKYCPYNSPITPL